MSRLITVVVVIGSCLLLLKSGAISKVLSQSTTTPTLDSAPIIRKSGDAMQALSRVHVSLDGTLVSNDVAGVKITGSGDLIYPHNENLSLQLEVPTAHGQTSVVAMNERIDNGGEYLQTPAQGLAWKNVTGDSKSQVAPGMDPIANLEFAHAFRAARDLGDVTLDRIDVHHFALAVEPASYIKQLEANPSFGIAAADEALLANAGIDVEVWISASDSYIRQMKIDVTTAQFSWSVTYHFSVFVKGGVNSG